MANLLSGASRPVERRPSGRGWRRCGACLRSPKRRARRRSKCSRPQPMGRSRRCGSHAPTPAQSMPGQTTVRRALERAEYVVVQEAFSTTATCRYADLLLPATTWGEKNGSVTNSERRISRVRPAVPPPAATRDDWAIATDLAHRLEARLRPAGAPTMFPYADAESVWNEHRESTRGRDLDITGLTYAALERRPGAVAVPRRREYGSGAAVWGRHLPDERRPGLLCRHRIRQACRASRRTLPVHVEYRQAAGPVARHEPHGHHCQAIRARAGTVPGNARQRYGPTEVRRRRPGAGQLAPRRGSAAGRRERADDTGAGVHRNALGRRIPGWPQRQRRARRRG